MDVSPQLPRPRGHHFFDNAGEPFFYLADTAWNGALKGTEAEWRTYAERRAAQGFTVIQFVLTPWRGCAEPLHGPLFEETADGPVENPAAFAAMDRTFAILAEAGLVASPVLFWTNNPHPEGTEAFRGMDSVHPLFTEATMITMGRRMVERWQKYQPLWILAGDGNYLGNEFRRMWCRIGRGVFADHPEANATMHPCGCTWVGDLFAEEPWYTFVSVQSGHGNAEQDLRWQLEGPFSRRWQALGIPFLDTEPNYERAKCYHTRQRHDAFHVRRGSLWSLLGAPTAGITYGTTGIWAWLREDGEAAEGHGSFWDGPPWHDCLESEGITGLRHIREFFRHVRWQDLRPADHLLSKQPGWTDPEKTVKAAANDTELVVYQPAGGEIRLQQDAFGEDARVRHFHPASGEWSEGSLAWTSLGQPAFTTPPGSDWLTLLNGPHSTISIVG